ncbi:MAG: ABC transporter permease [Gaiellales bacterium]
MSSQGVTQVGFLARRSVVRTLRQPQSIVPPLVFPLFLLAVNTGGLQSATDLPGFPTDSYLDFAIAFAFMQGALFAVSTGGTDLARDIQTGFLNRLALTPLRGSALLAGQLAGVAVLGVIQSVAYLAVGLVAGVTLEAGAVGALVLLLLALLVVIGFGGIGLVFALRTGSGEAVQGLFPLLFIMLFLSSMALPRNLIEQGWFRTIATYNPVSYFIEGMRSLVITGWDAQALALGFGLAIALVAIGLAGASIALRSRLTRT